MAGGNGFAAEEAPMKYITLVNGQEYTIELLDERHARINDQVVEVDLVGLGNQPLYSMLADGKSYEAFVYRGEEGWQVLMQGTLYEVEVIDEREYLLRQRAGSSLVETGPFHLKAPMPGLIVAVPVKVGQEVRKGEVLVILESMKMQNELKSTRDGKVTRVLISPGEAVEKKQTLVTVE